MGSGRPPARSATGSWLLTAVLAGAGLTLTATAALRTGSTPPAPPPAATGTVTPAAGTASPALGRSVPTTLRIPAIGVDTPLMRLGLRPDRTVEVPPLTRGAPAG